MLDIFIKAYLCIAQIRHLRYVCILHLSHAHSDVIVGLLINSSKYICVSMAFVLFFLMLKDIIDYKSLITSPHVSTTSWLGVV